MKMKKVLMILITLAVVFAMAGVVSAETGFKNSIDSMDVKYNVADSYIITIPSDVTFIDGGLKSENNQVNATNVLIGAEKYLHVNLTSSNPIKSTGIYHLMYAQSSYVPYYINKTTVGDNQQVSQVENGSKILTVAAGSLHPNFNAISGTASIGGCVNLTFETTTTFISNATKSGDHKDTLTFMCWVDDSN